MVGDGFMSSLWWCALSTQCLRPTALCAGAEQEMAPWMPHIFALGHVNSLRTVFLLHLFETRRISITTSFLPVQ